MALVRLTEHIVDADGIGGSITRNIRNWQNYRTPGGLLTASDPAVETQLSAPPDWSGTFDFSLASLRAPLQVFLRDSTDAVNRVMWGIRRSDFPNAWLNWKALGVGAGATADPIINPTERTVTWTDVWAQTDLQLQVAPHKVEKRIVLKAAGHPASFRFSLRIPESYSIEQVGDVLFIRDQLNVIRLQTRPLWGQDANGTRIRVALVDTGTITVRGRPLSTFRVVPHPDDMTSAVYPVVLDPTSTISGTTDIHDLFIANGGNTDTNFGINAALQDGWGNPSSTNHNKILIKITSTLPEGTISGFRMFLFCNSKVGTPTHTVRRIAAANTWVEGTVNGSPQVGSSCWNKRIYNTTNWAGSGGLSTATTDYETTNSTNFTTTLAAYNNIALPTVFISDWRDGLWTNNGVLIDVDTEAANNRDAYRSTEYGSGNNPYFEIDYVAGQPTSKRLGGIHFSPTNLNPYVKVW